MDLLNTSYLALFLIICLGFILGNIKIKGISLDISAIIFVALIFGHFNIALPNILEKIGLILFIYTIGLQAGPGFFDSFRSQGKNLVIMAFVVVLSAALLTLCAILFLGIEKPIAIGLLSGALTSTPGLAAAIDVTHSTLASIGYGIAYPFGVIGVILFVRLYPKIFRVDIAKEEKAYSDKTSMNFEPLSTRNFKVEHEGAIDKTIGELRVRSMTKGVISRVMHEGEAFTPTQKTVLRKGDFIKAVGTQEALRRIELLIGHPAKVDVPLGKNYVVQSYLITKPELVNKYLGELNLRSSYDATVTRLRRSGIELAPSPNLKLQMGDKLMIACSKDHIEQISKLLGDNNSKLSDTNFFPIATGIVLGILLGKVSLSFGSSFEFSLGLTGGILIISMMLGRLGKTGPILWTMSGSANQLLRQLGLMLFLASVGTKAGATLVDTFHEYGIQLFLVGGVITLVPMILAALVARMFLKVNVLSMLGTITGAMTSTPGLAATDSMTECGAPSVAYATVYPIAMVVLIICTQLLGLIGVLF
ncbi:putative transport protein [Pustulibacterium marinum]|uniref:Putative transport protein n=1 Tax=Pustulibacterium marinum TaxID=1224947 RepID=A0A1I7HWN9_9FLAO|nr:TrkA C-terminal domain-containing protein [Pustulibacterium marinum]SFU65134.1 putative transport protein [Pustulibacterium marinum]